MKVVLVGFKVAEENSVYYKKYNLIEDPIGELQPILDHEQQRELGELLLKAYAKGADFVSVRFIC